jgi:hypothetical protein
MPQGIGFINVQASADFLGPGAIEINRYQPEILDRVRRRFAFGQRITQTPATGQPSRYFEQLTIAGGNFVNPRSLNYSAGSPGRVERVVSLKALIGGINFGIFDVETTQQQGQFSYIEAKDLTDTVDGLLRTHDLALWTGNDTSLAMPTTQQYYGVSGQIINATPQGSGVNDVAQVATVSATGSLVDGFKLRIAQMVTRQDYEVRPSAAYSNPLYNNLFDQEAKQFQLYFNKVQVLPGVVVAGIPTVAGVIPLIPDAGITIPGYNPATTNTYDQFIVSEDLIEYHWLTNPLPRVFQLGLQSSLSAMYTVLKFGAVVAKGANYAHSVLRTQR